LFIEVVQLEDYNDKTENYVSI